MELLTIWSIQTQHYSHVVKQFNCTKGPTSEIMSSALNFYGWKIELSMAKLLAFFLEQKWALFQCIVALAIISGCYCKRINSYEYKIRPQPQEPLTHHQLIYMYIQSCCHGLVKRGVKWRHQFSLFEAQCRPQAPKKRELTEQNVFSIM